MIFYLKSRKLHKTLLRALAAPAPKKQPKEDNSQQTYLGFLNQAVLATEIRMEEEGEADEADDFDLGSKINTPLSLRRAFLEIEINAIDVSGEDGEAYWNYQAENLKSIMNNILQQSDSPSDSTKIEDENTTESQEQPSPEKQETASQEAQNNISDENLSDELVQQIKEVKEELHLQKKENDDMQVFKKLLYDLAGQVSNLIETEEKFIEISGNLDTPSDNNQYSESLNIVTEEHTKLSEVLVNLGKDSDDIDESIVNSIQAALKMRAKRPKEKIVFVDQAEHKLRKEVETLKGKTKQQQDIIQELQDELGDSEAASKIQNLQAAAAEAEMCITVLEEENQSRQEQLENLLMTIDDLTDKAERAEELEKEIETLTEKLISGNNSNQQTEAESSDEWSAELQHINEELSQQITVLKEEKEQLLEELQEKTTKVENLSNTIKRFSSETGDVMNSVVTLEDMNDQLMNEIDSLKDERTILENKIKEMEEISSSSEKTETTDNENNEKEMTDEDIEALLETATEDQLNQNKANAEDTESLQKLYNNLKLEKQTVEDSMHDLEKRLDDSIHELNIATHQIEEKEKIYQRLKKEFVDMETDLLMRM